MNIQQLRISVVRSLKFGFLFTCILCSVIGCSNSNAVQSESYKKLPPGEGEKRLQDTLKRRAEGRGRSAPLPADASVDQSK